MAKYKAMKLRKRIHTVREILAGQSGRQGLQVWFQRQVYRLSGYEPSAATVHRWVHGKTEMDPLAVGALLKLEEEAKAELMRRHNAIP